jgi:uncharacterized protein YggU (UPF0235/DUF167 family)
LTGASAAWSRSENGIRLAVHLTPKSSRNAVEGVAMQPNGSDVLKLRVRAVPEDGKANAAAIELLADWLKIPRSSFVLEAGGKSRVKRFRIDGDPAALESSLIQKLGLSE